MLQTVDKRRDQKIIYNFSCFVYLKTPKTSHLGILNSWLWAFFEPCLACFSAVCYFVDKFFLLRCTIISKIVFSKTNIEKDIKPLQQRTISTQNCLLLQLPRYYQKSFQKNDRNLRIENGNF